MRGPVGGSNRLEKLLYVINSSLLTAGADRAYGISSVVAGGSLRQRLVAYAPQWQQQRRQVQSCLAASGPPMQHGCISVTLLTPVVWCL